MTAPPAVGDGDSGGPGDDPGVPPADLWVDRAPHVDDAWMHRIGAAAHALNSGGVHYLAHYSHGCFDFAVHSVGRERADDHVPDRGLDQRRADYRRLGGRITFDARALDTRLESFRTGTLIRTVLQTDGGAVFCDSIVPQVYVVGIAVAPPTPGGGSEELGLPGAADLHEGDLVVGELATRIRQQIKLGPQRVGGDLGDAVAKTGLSTETFERLADELDLGEPEARPTLTNLCELAVDGTELHFVAYFAGEACQVFRDQLDAPNVRELSLELSARARRRMYLELGGQVPARAGELSRAVRSLIPGALQRMVLDVEQGAIYVYRLEGPRFLLGVSLDQKVVGTADRLMASLTRQSRRVPADD